MAFDDGNEWDDFSGDDGDFYEPTDEGSGSGDDYGDEPTDEGDGSGDGYEDEPTNEGDGAGDEWGDYSNGDGDKPDPKDDDTGVIDEPDDYSDTLPQFGDKASPLDNLATAEKVLKIATTGIGVLESVVRASGNKQAAAALAAVTASLKVGGDLFEFSEKTIKKQARDKSDSYDDVPVTVPTRDLDAVEKVRRAIAQSDED